VFNISGATFIRDTFAGAFCVFESIASWLSICDDITVLDCGSTDGTLQVLQEIASANSRIKVVQTHFSKVDAGAFADAANDCVRSWQHEYGVVWYADEIPHENLLRLLKERITKDQAEGKPYDYALWSYQLRENFQVMKWPPHPVHRVGPKNNFVLADDGTNTKRVFGVDVISNYNQGWFTKWGTEFHTDYTKLPTHEMLMDVGIIGGFIDTIYKRCALHAPMWHEQPNVEGTPASKWVSEQRNNPNWSKIETPYNIPHIMRWHVSRPTYDLRDELKQALKTGQVDSILGL
jgi:glycosyltransferase involved in cell wall biosynthesis